jgi:hypothetical protein
MAMVIVLLNEMDVIDNSSKLKKNTFEICPIIGIIIIKYAKYIPVHILLSVTYGSSACNPPNIVNVTKFIINIQKNNLWIG